MALSTNLQPVKNGIFDVFYLQKTAYLTIIACMKRHIYQKLLTWKASSQRKPLILNGVRQCGKSFILEQFANNEFPRYHILNFENDERLKTIFEPDLKPERIINELNFHLNTQIDITQDIVIFDEIQACSRALTSLKYFCENMPQLALCCAGSLLGVQLSANSFPVGKVAIEHLYPMSFTEFLQALDDQKSLEILEQCQANTVIPDIVHQHLWERLKWYFIIGGLPEAVKTFCAKQDKLFSAFASVREIQNTLIKSYYADMTKHAGKVNALHLDRVLRSVPTQLARAQDSSVQRFQFKGIIPGIDRYQRLANVIDWLIAVGLVIQVPIANRAELPLSAYTKQSHFKLFMFDVGILGALSELPPKAILDYDYGTYKGYFAENFVAQELLTTGIANLYAWQEGRSEVEFLYVQDSNILPIEVKSGAVTKAQSLQKFVEKYQPSYRTIISARPFKIDKKNATHCYPLYLTHRFPIHTPHYHADNPVY